MEPGQLAYPLNSQEPMARETASHWATRSVAGALICWAAVGLLTYGLRGEVATPRLEAWGIGMALVALFNLVLALWLLRSTEAPILRRRLSLWLCASLVLEGIGWGLAPVGLHSGVPVYDLMSLAFACVACLLAMHLLGLYPVAMVLFMLACLVPAIVMCLSMPDHLDHLLGVGSLMVLVLALTFGLVAANGARAGMLAVVEAGMLAEQLKNNNADLRTALRAIRQMATRDTLTQTYNRRAMLEYLEREMIAQDRGGRSLGMLLIDVDRFRELNDTHGHLVGDDVLKALVTRVLGQMRGNDFLARYGGEEFVCLMHAQDSAQLLQAAERIRGNIASAPVVNRGDPISVTVSIGATLRRNGEESGTFFARAEKAMKKAKLAGRNQVRHDLPLTTVTLTTPDVDLGVAGDAAEVADAGGSADLAPGAVATPAVNAAAG